MPLYQYLKMHLLGRFTGFIQSDMQALRSYT